jgi:hypothetical protein
MGLRTVSLEFIVITQLQGQRRVKSQTGYFIPDQFRLKMGIAWL